jgi:hypothetical protein
VASAGAEKGEPSAPSGKSDARILFDGKSLDGWDATDFHRAGEVKVQNGAIVMSAGATMTGITTKLRDLPKLDYELNYEAKRISGSDFFAAATFPVGDSYITLVNGGWRGVVTGLSSLNGADASENETHKFISYQDNTWYRFRVRVTGQIIRCWLDDKEIIAVDHSDRHVGTRVETRPNEPLGFATWKTTGAVREIKLRRLTPTEVAATNQPKD